MPAHHVTTSLLSLKQRQSEYLERVKMNYGQMMHYREDYCKNKKYAECEECQGWWIDIERCDSDHR